MEPPYNPTFQGLEALSSMINIAIKEGQEKRFYVEENGIQRYFVDEEFLQGMDGTKMVRYVFDPNKVQVYYNNHQDQQPWRKLGHVVITGNVFCDFGTGASGKLKVWNEKDHWKMYDIGYVKCNLKGLLQQNKQKFWIKNQDGCTIGHIEIPKFGKMMINSYYESCTIDAETKVLILGATFFLVESWRRYLKILAVLQFLTIVVLLALVIFELWQLLA